MVYALDSSTIHLCLTLFPWAKFRSTESAIKLHTMIDLRGAIPVFISITDGSVHAVNILDFIPFEAGSKNYTEKERKPPRGRDPKPVEKRRILFTVFLHGGVQQF